MYTLDPNHPFVCFDESSKQLIAEKIEPLPEPGKNNATTTNMNGVCNLFMFFEPLGSWRHVEVTRNAQPLIMLIR